MQERHLHAIPRAREEEFHEAPEQERIALFSAIRESIRAVANDDLRTELDLRVRMAEQQTGPEGLEMLVNTLEDAPNPWHYIPQPEHDMSWGSFFNRAEDMLGDDVVPVLQRSDMDEMQKVLLERLHENPNRSKALLRDWNKTTYATTPEFSADLLQHACTELRTDYQQYQQFLRDVNDQPGYQDDCHTLQWMRNEYLPVLEAFAMQLRKEEAA